MIGRRRHRSEAGMTVVEISVAVSLMLAVSAVFLPLLATATRTVRPMQEQSRSIDSLRNALAAIGREMRSASCVVEPSSVAGDNVGNTLTFVTDANNTTYEVTYTITAGQLTRQVTGEDAVTLLDTGLVDPSDAFTHIATPRRTVKVAFHFQHDPSRPPLDLSTVIAGRNAWDNSGC